MAAQHVKPDSHAERRWHRHPVVGAILVTLIAAMLGAAWYVQQRDAPKVGTSQVVTLNDRTFTLELALDRESRRKGLSNRTSIADDGGMLFVFPDARELEFWMRECLVPIDVIFLDPAGRIIAMHQMTVEPPGTPTDRLKGYPSRWPAQFAIELKGGTIPTLGLTEGQKIALPLDALKRAAH